MSPLLLRLLVLILVFAAVLLAIEAGHSYIRTSLRTGRAMNERLRLIQRGVDRGRILARLRRDTSSAAWLPGPAGRIVVRLERLLAGAGLRVPTSRLLLYLILGAILVFIIASISATIAGIALNAGKLLLFATFAVAAGFGLPFMLVLRLADRRRRRMVQQFPIALDVFIRGLRAGHPIGSALELLTEEMADPIGSEFGIAVDEMTYGADLKDALQNMADRCGVDDMQMFVVSLSVQGETGGNLAEILENLSRVIRERASMLLKVRALSSEGRMTAVLLSALPVLAFTALFLINPEFYLDVSDDPAFIPGFVGLLLLYAVGFFWIRRLVDLKV
ncbi:MAG TPA: type II secretion system F family protein [Allosphingosinicella sp.]